MLSPSVTLREFFQGHYLPHKIDDPTSRAVDNYTAALNKWELLTSNPPLAEITAITLCEFKAALFRFRKPSGDPLSRTTIANRVDHVQYLLKHAGPLGSTPTAAGLLERPPTTKSPTRQESYRPPAAAADVRALYAAADAARLPSLDGVRPGALWRALLSTICSTSLRIGQLCAAPTSALQLDQRLLVLPAGVCKKSKREEPHPLNDRAVADLMAIRSPRELLFPLLEVHSKTTIYGELHRLQELAGVPRFGFHDLRARVITELSAIAPAAAQLAAGHAAYKTTQRYQLLDLLGRAVERFDLLGSA